MNLSSFLKTARTPMTTDEMGAIKRSARMSVYVVAQVIAFVVWLAVDLWLTMWAALVIIPRMGRFVQDGLGVTSKNAPSTEVFISYWVAPMLLITFVVAAGVVTACVWLWRVRSRAMSIVRRWVDRAVSGGDIDESTIIMAKTCASLGTAKQVRSQSQRSRRKKR